jgi:hypothetical protein
MAHHPRLARFANVVHHQRVGAFVEHQIQIVAMPGQSGSIAVNQKHLAALLENNFPRAPLLTNRQAAGRQAYGQHDRHALQNPPEHTHTSIADANFRR